MDRGLMPWEADIWVLCGALIRNSLFVCVGTVFGAALVAAGLFVNNPYEAETEFLLGPLKERGARNYGYFEAELKFLASHDLALLVAQKMQGQAGPLEGQERQTPAEDKARRARDLLRKIDVDANPDTGQTWIRVRHAEADQAILIADLWRTTYHEHFSTRLMARTDQSKDWTTRALVSAQEKLDQTALALVTEGLPIKGARLGDGDLGSEQKRGRDAARIRDLRQDLRTIASASAPRPQRNDDAEEAFVDRELAQLQREVSVLQRFAGSNPEVDLTRQLSEQTEKARQADERRQAESQLSQAKAVLSKARGPLGENGADVSLPLSAEEGDLVTAIFPGLAEWSQAIIASHAVVEAQSVIDGGHDLDRERTIEPAALRLSSREGERLALIFIGGLMGFFCALIFLGVRPEKAVTFPLEQ